MNILLIDDHVSARYLIKSMLDDFYGLSFFEASSKQEAYDIVDSHSIDIAFVDIVLDVNKGNRDGHEIIETISQKGIKCIAVSVLSEIGIALDKGAYYYIVKDHLSEKTLVHLIQFIRKQMQLEQRVSELEMENADHRFDDMVLGKSQAMNKMFNIIQRVAKTDRPVLIHGPSGAGKEIAARLVHRLSEFPDEPFFDLNCGALPESLLEASLFGYEKGAFTGADKAKDGYLNSVGQGVLFLDEIAELPLLLQPKLLRVLETREFRPLGSNKSQVFKGRIVAATHASLEDMVTAKTFREDLWYRLNVFQVDVPSLKSRTEDIPDLLKFFSRNQYRMLNFSEGAAHYLQQLPWPGNIRQLRNLIDRLAILSDDDPITEESIMEIEGNQKFVNHDHIDSVVDKLLKSPIENKIEAIEAIEKRIIMSAVNECNGNKSAAARRLGVHRKYIERRSY